MAGLLVFALALPLCASPLETATFGPQASHSQELECGVHGLRFPKRVYFGRCADRLLRFVGEDRLPGAQAHVAKLYSTAWHGTRNTGASERKYMDILFTILIGLVVGVVAKFLMPGRDPGGFIITTLLGIAGAFVARFLGERLGWYGPGEPAGFIASVIGAMILLLLYRLLFRRRALPSRT